MSIYKSKTWMEDLSSVTDSLSVLKELAGKKVVITGAGGLICSAIVDLLICYNEKNGQTPIGIYLAGRSENRLRARFEKYYEKPYLNFVPYDAMSADNTFPDHVDYIIHGASNAFPELIAKEPVETMMSNINGLFQLLRYAGGYGAARVLYISSSEVYGRKEGSEPYGEDEYGFVDLLNPRNSYSIGKRAAETLCVSFSDEYGVDTVMVRPGHIYGPTASKRDNRVSSAWAYAAARGQDLVMKSDGSQIRSYCYCLDCASAILTVLLRGENRSAYNISNPNSIISIRQMAEIIAEKAGVRLELQLPSKEEAKAFNPMSNSSLLSEKLQGLGWKGLFDAEKGFMHTIQILKESGLCE